MNIVKRSCSMELLRRKLRSRGVTIASCNILATSFGDSTARYRKVTLGIKGVHPSLAQLAGPTAQDTKPRGLARFLLPKDSLPDDLWLNNADY
eukprot:4973177-Heterocapsa_arctica.AAC.1